MSTAKEVIKSADKSYGPGIILSDGKGFPTLPRLPSGIFPFDLATGGGIPMGRISIFYGPESALKTSIALKLLASAQRRFPKKKCVLIDTEFSYDFEWGAKLGVDNTNLIYIMPENAEQAITLAHDLARASDVCFMLTDSLAALTPAKELESDADRMQVGGASLLIGKLIRLMIADLGDAHRQGRPFAFVAINQIRYKIGQMMGNPETTPGGKAVNYASSLSIRLAAKDEVDPKLDPSLPAFKLCSGAISKTRVRTTAKTFEFRFALRDNPAKHLKVGDIYDWPIVAGYLKEYNLLTKGQAGFDLALPDGKIETFPTLRALSTRYLGELDYRLNIQESVMQTVKAQQNIVAPSEPETEDE